MSTITPEVESEGTADLAPAVSLEHFLDRTPPGSGEVLVDVGQAHHVSTALGAYWYQTKLPDAVLHCTECKGKRTHRFSPQSGESSDGPEVPGGENLANLFLTYRCRNCGRTAKVFAVRLGWTGIFLRAFKLGEDPPFGPPTPSRLTSLVGAEREYFLKGRRAESQSLGIAAFAYYRRVIENQRTRIFDAIITVAERLNSEEEMIADLRAAQGETQFSSGVARIKHGIPQALLINGNNPLTLLHSALSEGLHAKTDEECLELATSVRIVMTELAERLTEALKDEAELNAAVKRLLPARHS